MAVIVPISEMENTVKMFELSENEPVFITKDGNCSRVLMNIKTYNRLKELMLDIELENNYQRSEAEGGNVEAHEFLRGIRKG